MFFKSASMNSIRGISSISISKDVLRVDGELELKAGLKDVNGSIGSVGQSLKSNGAEVVWSSSSEKIYRATTSDDITISDEVINITSGSGTYSLPTAVGNEGLIFYIKNSGTGTITIDPNSSETIDGDTSITLTLYEALTICSDGSNWIVL